MDLGTWVRAERKRRGWTIKVLAERMTATGLTTANEPYLTQLETGKINAGRMGRDKLAALAGALELTVDELLQAAGVTDPPRDELTELEEEGADPQVIAEMRRLMVGLPPDKQRSILDYAHFLAEEHRRTQEGTNRQRRTEEREPPLDVDSQQGRPRPTRPLSQGGVAARVGCS